MKKHILQLSFLFFIQSCTEKIDNHFGQAIDTDFTIYVDPMIGTKNMGHVYPGATTHLVWFN